MDRSQLHNAPPYFNGSNYAFWKVRMRAILCSIGNSVWVGATYQKLVNNMFSHQIGRNVEMYVDDMLVKSNDEANHLDGLKESFDTLHKYKMKLNPSKCVFAISSREFLVFMVSQLGIEANPNKIKAIMEVKSPKTVKEVQSLT